ncbi:MAG: KH domain-containing protein [Eubacteriales bacterium]|nr:KH domain-containing protein [Eubacteriales bacterium]
MLELVKYIAQSLVEQPEEVKVTQTEGEKSVIIELSVARDDMGKVIGKQGRIAKALRTVVKAASSKSKKRYVVEIVEHD